MPPKGNSGGKAGDGKGKEAKGKGKDGKGKGKESGEAKGKGKGKHLDGGKGGGKGKGKPNEEETKEKAAHEYSLDQRPYWSALQELFKTTVVKPNDFDPKAVQLLDALNTAGKDKECITHLRDSLKEVSREKVIKMRAYVFKLMREFDKEVYEGMKESRGRPKPRKTEQKTSEKVQMSLSAPAFVPGKSWKSLAPEAQTFVPGQPWAGMPGMPYATMPMHPYAMAYAPPAMATMPPHMPQVPAGSVTPTSVPASPKHAPVLNTVPTEVPKPPAVAPSASTGEIEITFSVECKTEMGETVAIVGSIAELGSWRAEDAKKLETGPETFPVWKSEPFSASSDFEYKFVILKEGAEPRMETVERNRVYRHGTEVANAKFGEL